MFNKKKKMRLGEILIEQGVLTHEALERALEKQKKNGGLIGEVLLKMGVVKEEDIVIALARQFNYPYLPVQNCDISTKLIALVPQELAIKYVCIPIDRIKNVLTVIMVDPSNEVAKQAIQDHTGLRVQALVGTVSEVTAAIRKYYKIKDLVLDANTPSDNVSNISFRSALHKDKAWSRCNYTIIK